MGLLWILLIFFVGHLFWNLNLQKRERSYNENIKKNKEMLAREEADRISASEQIKARVQAAENQIKAKERAMLEEISAIRDETFYSIRVEREALEHAKVSLKQTVTSTKQSHPELAQQIADVQYMLDAERSAALLRKERPAVKAAEELKRIAGERRKLLIENRKLQYQLNFYEKLFPWLEEFKEVPSDEAISYATGSYGTEYDAAKKWLSPEEYQRLSTTEKFQLALDRWESRKKADWDVGIEYERYIGYMLETEGYKVTYTGATMGLKDMGRDLIASKKDETLVIQCKRWAKEKTIHEKHILQLYGSVAVLAAEHPKKKYKPVFVTTTSLSDTARKCADYCGIIAVENCPMGKYPLVKCNLNHDGVKIYHLPFDQQYDKIVISKNRGSCYAWTVEEAESLGFRHAYRWRPKE